MHLSTLRTAFGRTSLIPKQLRGRSGGATRLGIARRSWAWVTGLLIVSHLASGCTNWPDYVRNGFKVGPNYGRPPAPVAKDWIDAGDVRLRTTADEETLKKWWTVFNDPALDALICYAYQQNLSLRVAGYRILEARAQYLIDVGNLFPQTQAADGSFTRNATSLNTASTRSLQVTGVRRYFSQWNAGFNLSWELDFWGRFRRAIESDAANLDASVENYDDVLVTLLGDVSTYYVQYRTAEQRIKYAQENVRLQRETLKIAEGFLKNGLQGELDVDQTRSVLEQTEATIPELQINLRQAGNQLCILLGIPPEDLSKRFEAAPIPTAPAEVVVGIPADLFAAGRMSAARSGKPPPKAPKSAWPRPSSIRTSPSTARSRMPRTASRTSSKQSLSQGRSALRFNGTSSTMAGS